MDPITLIVTALAAGSGADAVPVPQDDVRSAVTEVYARLRGLVRMCIADRPGAEFVLAQHEADPDTWAVPLAKELTEAGAAGETDLVEVATALMELVDESGARDGKYDVTITNSPRPPA